MHQYEWNPETGGILLKPQQSKSSNEPRPVYYREMNMLGMDRRWTYPQNDDAPIMWAEAERYIYRGRVIAKTKGGDLYNAPEIIYTEGNEGEPQGAVLVPVDIKAMVNNPANIELMNDVETASIKMINSYYREYASVTNLTYVAFSGGKDSVVALDLVKRTLEHKGEFIVVFGNTDMEFPTTIELCKEIETYCNEKGIRFITTSAENSAEDSWRIFGPPSRRIRWCCTIRKTAPVINTLCQIYRLKKLRAIMITGVRREESASRSEYEEFSEGGKLKGQYSFHPIIDWSSAEVYLYLYRHNLPINEAYKLGFNRVGCIMCPNSSEKHEYIKRYYFPNIVDKYCDIITDMSSKDLSGSNRQLFLNIGGWKTRYTGRELNISERERVTFEKGTQTVVYRVETVNADWKTWYKTMGTIDFDGTYYYLEYNGVKRKCKLTNNVYEVDIVQQGKNLIDFMSLFRSVLTKSQYCIRCKACEAECPHRNISMSDDTLTISDKCCRCHSCLKMHSISDCCIYYHSIRGSITVNTSLKGINRYLSVGVDMQSIYSYLEDTNNVPGNRKTDVMFSFMQDAGILDKKKVLLPLGEKLKEAVSNGNVTDAMSIWACAAINLSSVMPFQFYIDHVGFDMQTTLEDIFPPEEELRFSEKEHQTRKKAQGEFWNGLKVILHTNNDFSKIGFGTPDVTIKTQSNGQEKITMHSITRNTWSSPVPEVILYGLFKFAEACGDYYQFSLSYLMDEGIERDGISPTTIFGLDRDTMIGILNGLAINYPDFISVSISLDLETITLKKDKKAEDVLQLF